jgi:hypothetical protein
VPIDVVAATIDNTIKLHCSKAELEKMAPFIQTEFVAEKVPDRGFSYVGGIYPMGTYYYLPYVTSEITVQVPVEQKQIPPGEIAVRRGTRVKATDGYVGKVDEFVINPENGRITYLVMREGHPWGKKHVIIPLSAMGDTREDTVFLNLNKHQVETLPTFPVHTRWS